MNKIIQGDNLEIMRGMDDESVDLICTDPPFNSGNNFGQFNDRWKSMDEYLSFMVPRMVEMRRLLKDTGSLYLHCDPTASHYLKVELDMIFGMKNFRNEIVWCYKKWSNNTKSFQKNHDIILYYSKCDNYTFNPIYGEFAESSKKSHDQGYFINYKKNYLLVYDKSRPKVMELIDSGKFDQIYYKDKKPGVLLSDHWTDIKPLSSASNERDGYPTQKPVKLYQRIINTSSNPGDLVLDPFTGSGTTLDAAQSLERRWIGIEINKDGVEIIKKRLDDKYGFAIEYQVEVNHD